MGIVVLGLALFGAGYGLKFVPGYRNRDWVAKHGKEVVFLRDEGPLGRSDLEELLRGK